RKDIEIAIRRVENVAPELTSPRLDRRSDGLGATEVRAASLLRNLLALQPLESRHRLGDRTLPGPADVDVGLQRLHRLLRGTVDHGPAHVADDEIGSGDRRIGQHGKHGLESTAGHEDELDLRMRAEKLVQALTVVWFTCEQGAIEIRGQEHALFSLRKAGCAAVRRLPVQARMA